MLDALRSLLIEITETSGVQTPSAALAYGLSLARQAGAHVTVQAMTVEIVVPNAWISGFAASLAATENERLRGLARAAAEAARAEAAAGLRCTARAQALSAAELFAGLAARARLNDLTLLDAEPSLLATQRGLIEDLILYGGGPLLVVPPAWTEFRAGRAVVAWDGSAAASRALRDALPLLRQARDVHVVTVTAPGRSDEAVPGAEVGPFLARHGVAATLVDLPGEDGVAGTLRRHAVQARADLLVMGGFVHARLREMVLGGVTAALLTDCPVPLLLAH
ncbi:universal stress protein [Methylobacterium sp. WSM2598]|uniref:universal stress protein n=1 Tax=Methylobacterium sp. WSM2598 TaxID=398261 RepID=UPI000370854D|nr:universal stress protein [Methylobacterium sp. WSM2598]